MLVNIVEPNYILCCILKYTAQFCVLSGCVILACSPLVLPGASGCQYARRPRSRFCNIQTLLLFESFFLCVTTIDNRTMGCLGTSQHIRFQKVKQSTNSYDRNVLNGDSDSILHFYLKPSCYCSVTKHYDPYSCCSKSCVYSSKKNCA